MDKGRTGVISIRLIIALVPTDDGRHLPVSTGWGNKKKAAEQSLVHGGSTAHLRPGDSTTASTPRNGDRMSGAAGR